MTVVVTGIGIISPIGSGTEDFWRGIIEGRSGAGPIKSFDASDLPVRIAAEIPEFDPTDYLSPREVGRTDRFTQLAVGAASMAWDEARGRSRRLS